MRSTKSRYLDGFNPRQVKKLWNELTHKKFGEKEVAKNIRPEF
jgi:hypothetical protein